jgi:hypothetical protein
MPDDAMSAIATELQLRVNGVAEAVRGLNEVSTAAGRVNMNARREFMGGQRLQSSFTNMLGINNELTQTIDSFERVGFMAQQAGMSTGEFFAKVAPGALSTAAAVGTMTLAWRAWGNEVENTNKALREGGYQEQSAWEFTKSLFGFGEGNKVDAANESAMLMRELNKPTVESRLKDWRGNNPTASREQARQERDRLIAEDKAAKDEEQRLAQEKQDRKLRQKSVASFFEQGARGNSDALQKMMDAEKLSNFLGESGSMAQSFMENFRAGKLGRYGSTVAEQSTMFEAEFSRDAREKERANREYQNQRDQAMGMAQQDFHRGPQYAGITLAGSHEARLDASRTEWEKSFDLQETANDYLRQLVDKASQTVIYGIN